MYIFAICGLLGVTTAQMAANDIFARAVPKPVNCASVQSSCSSKKAVTAYCSTYLRATTTEFDDGATVTTTATTTTGYSTTTINGDTCALGPTTNGNKLVKRAAAPACIKQFKNAGQKSLACSCLATQSTTTVTSTAPAETETDFDSVQGTRTRTLLPAPSCSNVAGTIRGLSYSFTEDYAGCIYSRQNEADGFGAGYWDASTTSMCEALAECVPFIREQNGASLEIHYRADLNRWECTGFKSGSGASPDAYPLYDPNVFGAVYGYVRDT